MPSACEVQAPPVQPCGTLRNFMGMAAQYGEHVKSESAGKAQK